jgi:hypothetical protein
MEEKLENKFFKEITINSDGTRIVKKELVIRQDGIGRSIETIHRSESPYIIPWIKCIVPWIKTPIIIRNEHIDCGCCEEEVIERGRYRPQDRGYDELNQRLLAAGS